MIVIGLFNFFSEHACWGGGLNIVFSENPDHMSHNFKDYTR